MTVSALDSSPIDKLVAAHASTSLPGGAGWQRWRGDALARFARLGLPTTRDENWKYTNLRLLERRDLTPAPQRHVDRAAIDALALPGTWHRLVFIDGCLVPGMSDPGAPAGCSIAPLTDGMTPAQLGALADSADDRVILLNAAFGGQGAVLRVAPGSTVATPLYCLFVATGGSSFPRLMIDMGTNSQATVVEHHVTLAAQESLAAAVSEVRVGDGAALEHYRVQLTAPKAVHLDEVRVDIARDGHYVQHHVALGAQLARTGARIRLAGRGATTKLNGLFMSDGSRHLETALVVDHLEPHTQSDQTFRGVASGRSRGVFNGKVVVHPGATRIESAQSTRNLLLSPQAEIDSRPQLEIYADDVKCSHGATTGSLDPNMMFYLLSRGLDQATARGLLTFAFAADVVSRMRLPELRRFLEERVIGQLPDADIIREFI